jgi:hypothetical protein
MPNFLFFHISNITNPNYKKYHQHFGLCVGGLPFGKVGMGFLMIIQRQSSWPLSPSLSPKGKERCFSTIPNILFYHINNIAYPNK